MIIDAVDVSDLNGQSEEDFIIFEERLREALKQTQRVDREDNSDRNGNYTGSYAPERYYVSSILAFLDSYNLEIELNDITDIDDDRFQYFFSQFFNKINYFRTSLILRKQRMNIGVAGTIITIAPNYKDEIRRLLDTILKIVNQEISDINKKEKIIKKAASLQSEVDRDRTTFDAYSSRILDFSKIVGEASNNLEPLMQKLERLKKLFWDSADRTPLITQKERPKLIEAEEKPEKLSSFDDNLDDEIPF